MPETTRQQKITFGELRASGVRGVLVYCSDYRCSHSIAMSADRWAGDLRLSDIERQLVCTACGKRGADVRPHFAPAKIGRRMMKFATARPLLRSGKSHPPPGRDRTEG
jgi:hypothetical protein